MKADKEKVALLLKTARGQLDGLLKMVENDRYCMDISNQLLATQAILKKANREVVHGTVNCRILWCGIFLILSARETRTAAVFPGGFPWKRARTG